MPSAHARLSASSAERWIHCPGSVAVSERLPAQPTTDYAEAGTEAHSLAELKLRDAVSKLSWRRISHKNVEELKRIRENGLFYDEEMEEATTIYVDRVLEEINDIRAERCLIEQRLDMTRWIPDGFGTSDAILLGKTRLEVVDFKYGQGVRVSAVENPQMRLYGLGALALFEDLNDFEYVRTTIVQPRLNHISSEEISVEELLQWGEEVVKPQAELASTGAEIFAAGDWCRFCPAKAICRERAKLKNDLARFEFAEPPTLSDDEIAEILELLPRLTSWASDISDYALQQALNGTRYDGFKIVEGRSVRKWSDDLKVAERLIAAGYDEALLYERRLNGITAMEKLVGKKKLPEIAGDLIIRPQGKPTLVPESDPREEFHRPAADDFND